MEDEYEKISKRYAKSLEESMQKTIEETSLFELKQLLMPFIEFNKEKKESVKLTDNEIDAGLLSTNYVGRTASAWRDGVEWAEKNKRLNEQLTWSKEECAVFRKKEWVGLTDEEKQAAYIIVDGWSNCVNFIEKTLREKNNEQKN